MKKQLFIMVFLGLMLASAAASAQMEEQAAGGVGTEGTTGTPATCTTCADCTSKLLTNATVKLIGNITDTNTGAGACIKIEKDNRVFDCDNHSIIASQASLRRSGILVANSASNPIVEYVTVQNCWLSNWGKDKEHEYEDAAIRLYYAEDCDIRDNVISGGPNGHNGIMTRYSSYNDIIGNNISNTKKIGIGINDSSNNNYVYDNYVNGSLTGIMPCHDGYENDLYNNEVRNSVYEGMCLCNRTHDNDLYWNWAQNNGLRDILQYNNKWPDITPGAAAGPGNEGDLNTCKTVWNWKDISATVGCRWSPL